MFISRSVLCGTVLHEYPSFFNIPTLPGDLDQRYATVHSGDHCRLRNDAIGLPHGCAFDRELWEHWKITEQELLCEHHPRHDAESVYWVMVSFLLRALPAYDPKDLETEKDDNLASLQGFWKWYSMSSRNPSRGAHDHDYRIGALRLGRRTAWENLLHIKLGGVGLLLRDLSDQVAPEYVLLKPEPSEVHLHEAMQRVILTHIWTMQQANLEIPLNVTERRIVYEYEIVYGPSTNQPTGLGFAAQAYRNARQKSLERLAQETLVAVSGSGKHCTMTPFLISSRLTCNCVVLMHRSLQALVF